MDNIKMMADAYKYRKTIESETVEIEENGIKITIGGDLIIRELTIKNGPPDSEVIKSVVNNAIRKAQEMMVEKMREMVDMNNVS